MVGAFDLYDKVSLSSDLLYSWAGLADHLWQHRHSGARATIERIPAAGAPFLAGESVMTTEARHEQ